MKKKGFGNTLDEINLFYIVKELQELFTEEYKKITKVEQYLNILPVN